MIYSTGAGDHCADSTEGPQQHVSTSGLGTRHKCTNRRLVCDRRRSDVFYPHIFQFYASCIMIRRRQFDSRFALRHTLYINTCMYFKPGD
jgi:hypothetical protein